MTDRRFGETCTCSSSCFHSVFFERHPGRTSVESIDELGRQIDPTWVNETETRASETTSLFIITTSSRVERSSPTRGSLTPSPATWGTTSPPRGTSSRDRPSARVQGFRRAFPVAEEEASAFQRLPRPKRPAQEAASPPPRRPAPPRRRRVLLQIHRTRPRFPPARRGTTDTTAGRRAPPPPPPPPTKTGSGACTRHAQAQAHARAGPQRPPRRPTHVSVREPRRRHQGCARRQVRQVLHLQSPAHGELRGVGVRTLHRPGSGPPRSTTTRGRW